MGSTYVGAWEARFYELTGPKPKGIKVETFRIYYLIRPPKVENLSLQPISECLEFNSLGAPVFFVFGEGLSIRDFVRRGFRVPGESESLHLDGTPRLKIEAAGETSSDSNVARILERRGLRVFDAEFRA